MSRFYISIFLMVLSLSFSFVHWAEAGSISLSWEPPLQNTDGSPITDLAGYYIHIGTKAGSYTQSIDIGNTTSQSIGNLIDGNIYYFTVTAYNISGNESSFSNEVNAYVGPPADTTPPVVSSVLLSAISTDSVVVTWDTDEASDSQVEYGTSVQFGTLSPIDPTPVLFHSSTLNGLSSNRTYYLRVRSKDTAGNLAVSETYAFTTKNMPPEISQLSADPVSGPLPLKVSFNAVASDADGSIVKYEWDFDGDGIYDLATGTTPSATYTYNKAGSRMASLKVTDDAGSTASAMVRVWTREAVGVYRDGYWYLDTNGSDSWEPDADTSFKFGIPGDLPVAGDWDGDGATEIGVFREGYWYLDANGSDSWEPEADTSFKFGVPGDLPVAGDWDGDGVDEIGVFSEGQWYLDTNGNRQWENGVDIFLKLGISGDLPITGDWDGDGTANIGVFRKGRWYLDSNGNWQWDKGVDVFLKLGVQDDLPVTGDWDGDGATDIGVFRGGLWYLDSNGNMKWDRQSDTSYKFGEPGSTPVTGMW